MQLNALKASVVPIVALNSSRFGGLGGGVANAVPDNSKAFRSSLIYSCSETLKDEGFGSISSYFGVFWEVGFRKLVCDSFQLLQIHFVC